MIKTRNAHRFWTIIATKTVDSSLERYLIKNFKNTLKIQKFRNLETLLVEENWKNKVTTAMPKWSKIMDPKGANYTKYLPIALKTLNCTSFYWHYGIQHPPSKIMKCRNYKCFTGSWSLDFGEKDYKMFWLDGRTFDRRWIFLFKERW